MPALGRASARAPAALAAALTGLVAVCGLAGCRSEAESFRLHLTWQHGPKQACPADVDGAVSCATIPISCDARVLIRILPSGGGVPYYAQCYRMQGATDACALAELEIQPSRPIPNEMVRVQVAVWSDEQLIGQRLADNGCPEDVLFDNLGLPRLDAPDPALVPALGGEIYFPVGDRHEAEVPLGCPRHDLLALEACLENPLVHATVRDPLSFGEVAPGEADLIDVSFGAPQADGLGGWTLGPVLQQLNRAQGSSRAIWSARLQADQPPEIGCVEVFLQEPRATLGATCQLVQVADGEIDLTGFVVRKALVDAVVRVLQLPDVPDDGLVVGIVVDADTQPVAGARVTVDPPSPIYYPSDQLGPIGLDSTSADGIFLSTTAPFDADWSASSPDGVGDDGTARGGLIRNHVSVVVIRLGAPIGGGQAR